MQITIKPRKSLHINLAELCQYRELFYFLAWRDIKVKYKQTLIGILWAILQPFLTMIIFTFFFNKVAGISSGNIPYPLFAFVGLIYWNYFSSSLTDMSNSMVANQTVITKVFFPRIIIPIASTFVGFVDMIVAFSFFLILMLWFHQVPDIVGIGAFLFGVLFTVLSVWGMGIFLSIVNVKYRDVRYALPFFIQLLLFITPVIYPISLVPHQWQWLLYLNPLTSAIDLARAGFFHTQPINTGGLLISLFSCVILFTISILYFQRYEQEIADVI